MVGEYDLVISALALHHTPPEQLKNVFRKICAVLRDGGLFINADIAARAEQLKALTPAFMEVAEEIMDRTPAI